MAASGRRYILDRRNTGIGDLSNANLRTDGMGLAELVHEGVYTVNCTFQVGIATSSEVGLSADRYPIRVVLVSGIADVARQVTHTVCRFWMITDRAGVPTTFSRKGVPSDVSLKNIYRAVPDLDTLLWDSSDMLLGVDAIGDATAEVERLINSLYDITCLLAPTGEQTGIATALIGDIITACIPIRIYPRFRICDNMYLVGKPHGDDPKAVGTFSANFSATIETMLCTAINSKRLTDRHPDLDEGIITLGSVAIGNMFRMGMFESFEHQEYHTVHMAAVAGAEGKFSVVKITPPRTSAPPPHISVGDVTDISGFKVQKEVIELANTMVLGSGLMHYLFNHTTGGSMINGILLSTLSMYKFIDVMTSNDTQTAITTLMYECLHPVNKRAVANIFFAKSGVTTHGRCSTSYTFRKFKTDAFITLRCNPYPAGSHKAMICLQALKRVLQAGLGPFLPWAEQITPCITLCTDVLKGGARAHIGSHYYTGEPSQVQPASIDQFLPELAQFIKTFNRGDSLGMSPHMSEEIAKRSGMNWQNLLKDLKAKDISSTSAEVVKTFLRTTGGVYFAFDPEDEGTWATAAGDANIAMKAIDSMFN